jgi:hypothetical protein
MPNTWSERRLRKRPLLPPDLAKTAAKKPARKGAPGAAKNLS